MRKFLLFCLFIVSYISYAQPVAGDLAFTALNADGNDDFSLVALKDIPANTVFYFRDDEWNGSAVGAGGAFVDAAECSFSWNSGASIILAGTIISFTTVSNTTLIAASAGTVTYINTANTGMGGNDEALFCYLGTDVNTPTVFITAFGKGANAFGPLGLNGTGLTEGSHAIYFTLGIDIAAYTGVRTGLTVNGYQTGINNISNWVTQDGSGDQSIDATQPDVPFSTTGFTFVLSDVTPPLVISAAIAGATSIEVIFNESVTNASATTIANYTINGAATINSIIYDDAIKKATLTTSTLTNGFGYVITVNNITDVSSNTMTNTFTSGTLLFNNSVPPLVITEIMYNALNIPQADALEFIEIYNNSAAPVEAGGLKIKDGNNFDYTLPSTTINANGFLLLAIDKAGAEAFYTGVTFLDLPSTGNVLGNGGELIQLRNSLGNIVDEVTYDDVAPWPTDADEKGYSLELYRLDLDNNNGSFWGVPSQQVGTLNGSSIFATPGSFSSSAPPISFVTESTTVPESAGSITIPISIAFSDAVLSSSVEVVVAGGNGIATTDFTFTTQLATFPPGNGAIQNVNFTVVDNTSATQDKYVVLEIRTPQNGSLGSIKKHILFIKDNDKAPLVPSQALNLSYTGNYKVPEGGSSAEISAYDPTTKRLFVVNSLLNKMEILDFSNPASITRITTINMAPYGAGLNSIATKNGIVAVAVENTGSANGNVAFFNTDGVHQVSVTAGNLPDMITFSPDGKLVLTANEAQPITYTPFEDPEGSVTIVDISGGIANLTQSNVTTVNFNAFDSQKATLISQGIRIFGPGSTVSQDLEPEYLTVSADSKKAYVTLQENNAIATIDLVTKSVTSILPLGYKDHMLPENSFDASDLSGQPIFGTWKVKGMYHPDAIAYFETGGISYVITANEGDARDYTGLNEEATFGSLNLDATAFPDADILKRNNALGRLIVTTATGDTDLDGDFDEVYVFGGRSFTIWNATTGAKVFDSGNQLERLTAEDATWGAFFNANNSSGNPSIKNRSDNKGPEPEGVAVAMINGKHYAFIALERIGGVVTYDVSNPAAPIFVGYDNNRSNPAATTDDLGSEGILYISPDDSPTGTALVVLSNEVSATVSVYTIDGIVNVAEPIATAATDLLGTSFTANWEAVAGVTSYKLDVSDDGFVTFISGYEDLTVTGTSKEVTGLEDGKMYQYRVRAVSGSSISDNSNVITILITGLENESNRLHFSAYPNPATGILNFSEYANFEMLTPQGVCVKAGKNVNHVLIHDLNEGIYILRDDKGGFAKILIKR